MKPFFSIQALISMATIFLSLLSLYLLFQMGPYLSVIWQFVVTVSLPFMISLIIAYLLHPLVDALMKFRLNRTASILLVYLVILGGIFLFFWWGTPIFLEQLEELLEQLPVMEEQLFIYLLWLDEHLEHLPRGLHQGIEKVIDKLELGLSNYVEDVFLDLSMRLNSLFILLIVPFLVFYLLQDVELIAKVIHLLTPKGKRKALYRLWQDIDTALGEYIRGQIMVSILVGFLALIGYSLIGLPYPLFLASIVAVTNLIPYFGPFFGAVPALFIALVTKPTLLFWVMIINIAIQVLEGNLLSPYIVGKRLAIHPIFIILVLLVGAELGGVLGLVLAVPIFVMVKEIMTNIFVHMRANRQLSKIDRI